MENSISQTKISIVIPTLNEEQNIEETIQTARKRGRNIEIIIVDGGSTDRTIDIVKNLSVDKFIHTEKGRARQMNIGFEEAEGTYILFLHADTLLPRGYDSIIRYLLKKKNKVTLGAFEFTVNGSEKIRGLKFLERVTNWRSRFSFIPYGDQALFIKKKIF